MPLRNPDAHQPAPLTVGLGCNDCSQGVRRDCGHPGTGIGVPGFPKMKVREETPEEFPDKMYPAMLSTTREAAQRKGGPSGLAGGLGLLGCIYKWGAKRAHGKGGAWELRSHLHRGAGWQTD